jgi:hypothetical protein
MTGFGKCQDEFLPIGKEGSEGKNGSPEHETAQFLDKGKRRFIMSYMITIL